MEKYSTRSVVKKAKMSDSGDPVTFSASYSHDRLKADLPGEVAVQILLELLQLCRVVDVMEGGVVKDAAR